MKRILAWRIAVACVLVVVLAAPAMAQEFSTVQEWAVANGIVPGSGEGGGGAVIETFPDSWAISPIGLAYDFFDDATMWYFHEADPSPGIWMVATAAGHAASPFTYTKLGGPNTDGGSIRPTDGYIYTADFNGDGLITIGDNIYLFDRTGATVALWETADGTNGPTCTGSQVNNIVDVAYDHGAAGDILYATSSLDNLIYEIDVSNTAGGSGANSSCSTTIAATAPAPIANVVSIEYDPCNDGYWLADFVSANIVLVANDGTFNTIIQSFTGSSGAGFNTAISPQDDGSDPLPVWVTDFTTIATTIFDSGLAGCQQEADLSITKDGTVNGNQILFDIWVTNNGPGDATNVVVLDPLPAEVTYVSDTCAGMNVPPWTWNVGALAASVSAHCTITVNVNAGVVGQIDNTATVSADQTDPNPGNESSTVSVFAGSVLDIPTLDYFGLLLLLAALAGAGLLVLRRK